jgi:hypothetical protein
MTKLSRIAGAAGLLGASASAFAVATPPDLSGLTGAIDLTTVVAAIVAVAVFKFAPQITKYAVAAISRMFPK